MAKSIEPLVETWAREQISRLGWKHAPEQIEIDKQLTESLNNHLSKQGGTGGGRPDHTLIMDNGAVTIPVFIEHKGTKSYTVKTDKQNLVVFRNEKGELDFTRVISKYAVNGAAYYASCAVQDTTYEQILAIGTNGWVDTTGETSYEVSAYLVTVKNPELPIFIGKYKDLSFLDKSNTTKLFQEIADKQEDPEELHRRSIRDEAKLDAILKNLNQYLHDQKGILPAQRIFVVSASLMASIGVKDGEKYKVAPLEPQNLKGSDEEKATDGDLILNKVSSALKARKLPEEKQKQITNALKNTLVYNNLNKKSTTGMSPIAEIYKKIYDELRPAYQTTNVNDFTGRLFNVMNSWVDVPDGGANDVVLTPRYVTHLMAELCEVDMNSYVWDWALGSGGFLISAMNIMLSDAQERLKNSPEEYRKKEFKIKHEQLLGIELLPDIYMLAVLNMILMGDGSSNIVNENSLTEYQGNYAYQDKKFEANVFLLNPPYSAEGNGLIFVQKAFEKMKSGKGAVIIQDSVGTKDSTKYIKKAILDNNRMIASIKMPADLFKASVQTSIYLFEVGKRHKETDKVKFIDFREDGYTRTNRKKASSNLKDTNDARGHYKNLVEIVSGQEVETEHFKLGKNYFLGMLDLEKYMDWNLDQHQYIDIQPTFEDFRTTVSSYLSWEVDQLLKSEDYMGK
ncbi:HsdM family class I SAM-dependent methyltransferase [Lactococcus lactis]|uniref:HsdM family class I SAM-dependent methyltransferase n=2 Tax=Lactococcus TaxID=1357 RepID=UPI00289042CB|nr:N-6 DNA methylase [Lactococcus lactis]MDT2895922.1 N-6 DNA methylase [Lactococcus lactis]MDT2968841.1 N-6 DNA methylase [Lactococcus lactis]